MAHNTRQSAEWQSKLFSDFEGCEWVAGYRCISNREFTYKACKREVNKHQYSHVSILDSQINTNNPHQHYDKGIERG